MLFAIAEELGKIRFHIFYSKYTSNLNSTILSGNLLSLLPSLEILATVEETVVRDRVND